MRLVRAAGLACNVRPGAEGGAPATGVDDALQESLALGSGLIAGSADRGWTAFVEAAATAPEPIPGLDCDRADPRGRAPPRPSPRERRGGIDAAGRHGHRIAGLAAQGVRRRLSCPRRRPPAVGRRSHRHARGECGRRRELQGIPRGSLRCPQGAAHDCRSDRRRRRAEWSKGLGQHPGRRPHGDCDGCRRGRWSWDVDSQAAA